MGKGYGYNLLPIIFPEQQADFEQYMAEHASVFNNAVRPFANGTERLLVRDKAWFSHTAARTAAHTGKEYRAEENAASAAHACLAPDCLSVFHLRQDPQALWQAGTLSPRLPPPRSRL